MSPTTDPPAERARERRILLWMCVLIAVNQLGFGGVVPVLPLYAQSFGVTASAIGMAVAIYGLARFVVAMPTGQLADALGRRPTLALGGIVSALGNLWCALAAGYPEFIVARFLAGAGASMVITCGVVVLADISVPARRGRTMALYQGAFLFAVGIGPLPGGLLAERFGLEAPFLAYAVLGTVAGCVAWFAVEETRDDHAGAHGAPAPPRLSLRDQLRVVLSSVGFRLVTTIQFMNATVRTGALFAIVPLIGAERVGLSAARIGFGLAVGSVLGLLATYPAGVLVDRHGRKAVIVPATLATGLSMLLFAIATDYAWFLIGCAVWGVAISVGGAAPAAYAADCAPPGMNASAMSTFRMLGDLGYVIGPIALGLLADARGTESALYLSAFAMVAIGAVFWRYAPETYRRGP